MSKMTERQAAAWPGAVAEVQQYVDTSTIPADLENYQWAVHWMEESRPGRGCSLSAVYCDGEYFAQVSMDVYGYPSVAVAEVSWLHNSSDDECECAPCKKEREDDE
ncbi:hypothetical protein [Glaciibacter psychrotolerans]|uniref:Uncharacterized protein n=1 Tax=Glaciibacter psychrotolerans TaxID=670054 RepID=A0A7Z0J5A2_9MICO|nr:hypothetical protein [Leifsonia psychrotolerans]NYJ19175.1 hypothetical protein [Leifsonia psychrotolerans]